MLMIILLYGNYYHYHEYAEKLQYIVYDCGEDFCVLLTSSQLSD